MTLLTFEHLNLSELTEIAVEEQALTAASRHIQIHTEITPDLFACVDETAYFRLLINLLSNAVTYGKENGNVWISLTLSGSDILLQIRDDGIGMSEEVLSHIWERFYRADSSRTGDSHFGLGLSMVQWIVTAHGGTITAQSKPSAGSTFTVFLPASHSQEDFEPKKIKKNEKNERF
ncbi:sensor histidine kinase [Coprococcus sp. AF21-14LB]|nr:sensor histidine kinase [Coprococcus sp. AF21-14LB]